MPNNSYEALEWRSTTAKHAKKRNPFIPCKMLAIRKALRAIANPAGWLSG